MGFTDQQIIISEEPANIIAEKVSIALNLATEQRGYASMVVAGGNSFIPVYQKLAQMDLLWQKISVFFGDERKVPLDDRLSNYAMASQCLGKVWEPKNTFPLEERVAYEKLVSGYLDRHQYFDICLLGIGADGHTASLFPAHQAEWGDGLVAETEAGLEPFVSRLTLTPRALNESETVIFLACGEGKAEIVAKITEDAAVYPVSFINPIGKKFLVLDSASAQLLKK